MRYPSPRQTNGPAKLETPAGNRPRLFGRGRIIGCRVRIATIIDLVPAVLGLQIKNVLLAYIHGEEARAVFAEHGHLGVGLRLTADFGIDANRVVHTIQKTPRFRNW